MPFGTEAIGILLLLKAFAGGSVALTGVEAIANGVPAFKPPEVEERGEHDDRDGDPARRSCSSGSPSSRSRTACARPRPAARPSSRSPRRRSSATARRCSTSSRRRTALILFLAANTSFNAFPRLAAILAEDGYMPRQFSFRGDRLAYSWGIVLLAARRLRAALGVRRRHPRPDPALLGRRVRVLHAQPGRHGPPLAPRTRRRAGAGGWRQRVRRGPDRRRPGIVVTVEKFDAGAYLVVILVPLLVGMMLFINRQYTRSARRARGPPGPRRARRRTARSGSSCRSPA